tara:strand:- start:170 stop:700 length:531 start_codon:yes stop_codon:yes gene_type:complete
MTIEKKFFVQNHFENKAEWKEVKSIANGFYNYLTSSVIKKALEEQNIPGAQSQRIEEVITPYAEKIGFTSQKKGLFDKYKVSKLTPDYFLPVNDTGILIEVERGQTTQNNAALKDLWKAHICEEADYLFLFVPNKLIQNKEGKVAGKPFNETVNRISTFYDPINYTNVKGTVIFGY